mmetsp:Transcript_48793/g.129327  ORF Transcript_48793/g.129327 Transcript_48793/m.129327 type:complete len:202 (-) Transcript_48793:601-1206(-)
MELVRLDRRDQLSCRGFWPFARQEQPHQLHQAAPCSQDGACRANASSLEVLPALHGVAVDDSRLLALFGHHPLGHPGALLHGPVLFSHLRQRSCISLRRRRVSLCGRRGFETVFFFCADGFAHLVHVHVWRSRLVGRDQASAGYRCRLRSSVCPFHNLYDDCRPQHHHRYLRQRRCGAGADGRGLEGADGVEGVPVPDRQA